MPQDATLSIDAGSYGTLHARRGSTITFTGGIYNFAEWDVGENVFLDFEAPSEVRIQGRLTVDQGSYLGPSQDSPDLAADDIAIYVTGINGSSGDIGATPKAAKFGIASTVKALVYVPNGTLYLRQNAHGSGAFIGRWVTVGIGVSVELEGGW